jgi:hypothetical protein
VSSNKTLLLESLTDSSRLRAGNPACDNKTLLVTYRDLRLAVREIGCSGERSIWQGLAAAIHYDDLLNLSVAILVFVLLGGGVECPQAVLIGSIDTFNGQGAALDYDVVARDLDGPSSERVDTKRKHANRRKKGNE